MNAILTLDAHDATDRALVGAKAAALARMRLSGFPAPAGFVVPVPAFHDFLMRNALLPGKGELSRPDTLMTRISGIDRGIAAAPIPPSTITAVRTAYAILGGRVAVRSSGVAEDSELSSFAGAYVSSLDRIGDGDVISALRECWRSAFSARVAAYRLQHDLLEAEWLMGVIVQRMVVADKAGVMFTRDPFSAHQDSVLIEAVEGACDRIVAGAPADLSLSIDRSRRTVLRREERTGGGRRFGMGASGLLAVGAMRQVPLLGRREIDRLIDTALALEQTFGGPQDVEWAFADGDLVLLQTRPLTARPVGVQQ